MHNPAEQGAGGLFTMPGMREGEGEEGEGVRKGKRIVEEGRGGGEKGRRGEGGGEREVGRGGGTKVLNVASTTKGAAIEVPLDNLPALYHEVVEGSGAPGGRGEAPSFLQVYQQQRYMY